MQIGLTAASRERRSFGGFSSRLRRFFLADDLSSRTETRARICLGPKSEFKNGPQPFLAPDAPR